MLEVRPRIDLQDVKLKSAPPIIVRDIFGKKHIENPHGNYIGEYQEIDREILPNSLKLNGSPLEMHGFLHEGGHAADWDAPRMVMYSDALARPGYNSRNSSEYYDTPKTLSKKIKLLAKMIKKSNKCTAYTGAGISTSAGINDYASSNSTTSQPQRLKSPYDALPTLSHKVLSALHSHGLLKHWIQQNHDGLPQKAGFPQSSLNEIHGSWYDPSNPVIPMDGHLRFDLFQNMLELSQSADLVLACGTSLAGMSADCVVQECAKRSIKCRMKWRAAVGATNISEEDLLNYSSVDGDGDDNSLGAVLINLQQTSMDDLFALRIFGKADTVFGLLAEELSLGTVEDMKRPEHGLFCLKAALADYESKVLGVRSKLGRVGEHTFGILFDQNGQSVSDPSDITLLDLTEGSFVKIVGGMFDGDCGVVTGVKGTDYHIRFFHHKSSRDKAAGRARVPLTKVLGGWWLLAGVAGLGVGPGVTFPVVNCSAAYAAAHGVVDC